MLKGIHIAVTRSIPAAATSVRVLCGFKCSAAVQRSIFAAQLLTRLLPQLLRMGGVKSLSALASAPNAKASNPSKTLVSDVSAFTRVLRSGQYAPPTQATTPASPITPLAKPAPLRASLKQAMTFLQPARATPAYPITPVAKPAPSRASVPSIGTNQAMTLVQPARAARYKQSNHVNRAKHCNHGRRATRCPECIQVSKSGTRSLCAHLKQKGWCLECKKDGARYYGEGRVWG
jgi:hypothetical protein